MNGGLGLATVDSWKSIKGLWLMILINGELKRGFQRVTCMNRCHASGYKMYACKNNQHYWRGPDPL